MNSLYEILCKVVEKNNFDSVCECLNISKGTVRRWLNTKKVPKQYMFELMKIANIDIDYSHFDFKDKDQFFTPISTAKYCYSKFLEIVNIYQDNIEEYKYIEPSAGSGNFLQILPPDRRIGIDIQSENKEVIIQDYIKWKPDVEGKYIVIGNPPFGLRGHMALKFINHSSQFSDYVCFILPQMFESDGKGSPKSRVKNLNLIHTEKMPQEYLSPNGDLVKVNCIFQIWAKFQSNILYTEKNLDSEFIKIYSLSDGGTPGSTRNKKFIGKCDTYIPSTCFGKEKMRSYMDFEDLPNRRGYGIIFTHDKENYIHQFNSTDWSDIGFLSTNGAYNIRKSQILTQFIILSTNFLKSKLL
jgi:predicted RNA methylase